MREKKEKSGDKKRSETIKKDKNHEERKIKSLFMREKEVKRVILPMYLLMLHDYCLSSISSSFPLGVEELLKKFGDVFLKDPPPLMGWLL